MGSSQVLSFLLFIFFPFYYGVTAEQFCRTYACGGAGPAIRFPFRIKEAQPNTCGYSGFDLKCSDQGRTILDLPNSGRFWIEEINYAKQEIGIVDPYNCLWRRLLSLDLSGSPFRAVDYENYTLLRCSTDLTMVLPPPPAKPIDCLSNWTHIFWATASGTDAWMMSSKGCQEVATVPVPVPWPRYYDGETSFSDLSGDLRLTWDVPQCVGCEEKGGRCGFISNYSLQVGCFDVPRQGLSRSVRYAMTIGVGIPALLCGIGIACYVSGRLKTYEYRRSNPDIIAETGSSSTVNPQLTASVLGLDDSTIQSYPKFVLGESGRLPKLNDNPCPICLAEYQPKETLRTIPHCQHSFHADCIDEWLRTNVTCPVCRTSPAPVS
ncbi:hypothetical protein NE237_012521 [Protea cynaroides]|uniref:RING-type E3 ubiquitin transferase n=1 Tax=Protea cynaroides TaxID=273540 RepID=A0A9Q0GXM1_9MAGN|nr:hypothetical protein NE237_012521 [Protea cynaroides]